ncbi:MAG: dockerin type I domain-containing protein [Oscillospiraceae bacterium]|jgi:hypothetical protein|nr:dockerin type I domain-containing protein [Oscillospiraceae bacterium]
MKFVKKFTAALLVCFFIPCVLLPDKFNAYTSDFSQANELVLKRGSKAEFLTEDGVYYIEVHKFITVTEMFGRQRSVSVIFWEDADAVHYENGIFYFVSFGTIQAEYEKTPINIYWFDFNSSEPIMKVATYDDMWVSSASYVWIFDARVYFFNVFKKPPCIDIYELDGSFVRSGKCARILQFVCFVNNIGFLGVADDGFYLMEDGGDFEKISDDYGNGPYKFDEDEKKFTDSQGREFYIILKNGKYAVEKAVKQVDSVVSQTPEVFKNGRITGIATGTTVAQIKKSLLKNISISKIVNYSGKQVTAGRVGTGMRFYLNTEQESIDKTEFLTAVVQCDVTGEGNVNSRDITAVAEHILQTELLQNEYLQAADINDDTIVDLKDLLLLQLKVKENS